MNHDEATRYFDALGEGVSAARPPTADLIVEGRVAERRKARKTLALAAASVALIVGGGAVATQVANPVSDTNRQNVTAAQALDTPAGTRLVGLGRVAVAVPNEWDANAASCNTPFRDTYYFPFPQDCQAASQPDVSSIAISTTENAEATRRPLFDVQRDGTVDGYDVRSSGLICTPGQGESCFEVFGIPDLDTWFTVRVPRSDNATDTIEAIRDSLTVLPSRYTTIPFTPYGTEQQVTTAMREAGLTTEVEYTTCPAGTNCIMGVSDIEPAVGAVVPTGSNVTVTVLELAGPSTQGKDVVLSADPAKEVEYPAALLSGQLTLQDGCLALDGSPTLWPAGSAWDQEEMTVVFADGSRLKVGDRVKVGGGSVPPSVASNYSVTAQEPIDACMRSLGAQEMALISGTVQ